MERPHVVVVDEEPLMRWFLGELAKDAGCRVTELQTLDMSLAYLRSAGPVDLVLLDCPHTFADLPRASAIRWLRPDCRLVLMTAFPTDRFVKQAQTFGVHHVLGKPIDVADVAPVFGVVTLADRPADRPAAFHFEIPRTLQRERHDLRVQLADIAIEHGPVGDAAREVERIVQTHAMREDSFALQPLGLLPMLACGLTWSEMRPAVAMAANLTSNLPRMLEDHEAIVASVDALEQAARRAGRTDLAALTRRLIEHADMEAEVLYPAAIVAGKFLESRLADQLGSLA